MQETLWHFGPVHSPVLLAQCTIPDSYAAGFRGGQAEAVTLTATHTQGNPNWITFLWGVGSVEISDANLVST